MVFGFLRSHYWLWCPCFSLIQLLSGLFRRIWRGASGIIANSKGLAGLAGEFIDECTSLAVNKDKDAVNLKLKQLIANNKLIMLDDIGKHKITDAGGEVLYKFLDIIIESNSDCKVWITANKHIDQICSRFYDEDVGNAFVSRIKRMEFVNVTQNGLKWGVGQI